MNYATFRPGFAAAMGAFHAIEELDEKIANGTAILWTTDKSAVAGEIQKHPNALVLHCLCATGDMKEIVGILAPQAEEWARRAGCTHITVESREGWAKVLKSHGYKPHTITLAKAI